MPFGKKQEKRKMNLYPSWFIHEILTEYNNNKRIYKEIEHNKYNGIKILVITTWITKTHELLFK